METLSNPHDFLKQVLGKPVIVKLTNNTEYRGILVCLDGFMHVALEQCEEIKEGKIITKYGDAFLRGNNGRAFNFLYIRSIQISSNEDEEDTNTQQENKKDEVEIVDSNFIEDDDEEIKKSEGHEGSPDLNQEEQI